jgi:hypothetical protein
MFSFVAENLFDETERYFLCRSSLKERALFGGPEYLILNDCKDIEPLGIKLLLLLIVF